VAAWLETALTMDFFLILVVDGGDASSPSATRNLALLVRAEVVARIWLT
jgi:hypothetical protein